MKSSVIGIVISLVFGAGLIWSGAANAVPAFARKYDMNCSGCHTAFPQLNATGRQFKEAGYRFQSDRDKGVAQEISDFLQLEKHVPISGFLVSRPFDKKKSGDPKIRAIHEAELIVAGNIARDWSGWFELEAEDEADFSPEVGTAVATYNYNPAFNVIMSWAPVFFVDPYGILVEHFKMTRSPIGAADQAFGGADADNSFGATRQNVGVYGRVAGRVFYNANWSGDAKDTEGTNGSTYSGLVDVDVTDNVMIGAFGMSGDARFFPDPMMMPGVSFRRDYSRYGVQAQADVAAARIQGIFVQGKDDRATGVGSETNNAYSLQAFWTFTDDTLRPTWVPLIRYDSYEANDGADNFKDIVLNLSYYVKQNIKAYVEYWNQFDAPTSADEDERVTLQIIAGF